MEYDKVEEGQEKVELSQEEQEKYPEYTDGTYPFVEFDAFFLRDLNNDGEADGVRGTCNQIGKEDTLYIELKQLTNGYIKEGATITINGEAGKDRNFYFESAIVKDNEIKDNYVGVNINQITLKQIGSGGNGVQKLLTGVVKSGNYTYESTKTEAIGNNIENYSKENTITFKGIHVRDDGNGNTTEIPIEKTVKFTVDWYGRTKTEIPQYINNINNIRQNGDIEKAIDETNNEINLEFTIGVEEVNNELILSRSFIEGTIPQLSEHDPKKVEVTGTNVEYTYDKETRNFTAQRQAVLDDENNLTDEVKNVKTVAYDGTDSINREKRYNKYTIKVTYDLEAYKALGENATIEYRVPVKAYYEGYNNKNNQFENPKKSNTAQDTFVITFRKFEGYMARFDVYVGKYISSPTYRYVVSKEKPLKIYNEISESEQEDYYEVNWYASMGSEGQTSGIIMKETEDEKEEYTSDQFVKTSSTKESMEEVTSFVGIYFSDPVNMLGEEGEIKVFDDETGILLGTFNERNWKIYTKINPYRYETPVKHIRIETTSTNANSGLSVYNIKELDDEAIVEKYEKEDFDTLKQIESTLAGYVKATNSAETSESAKNTLINTDIHFAYYEAPYAISDIMLSKSTISTQETEKNMKITIKAQEDNYRNQIKWSNGVFLLKLPEHILDIKINSITTDNNEQVQIANNIQYEEEGTTYIRIDTECNEPTSYNVIIDCDITPDPRMETRTEQIELYAYNENAVEYYNTTPDTYDLDGDLNTSELITKETVSLNMISPNSLLTNESVTNFNSNTQDVVVAPKIAEVQKGRETADINIEIKNNYTNDITDVKILGKVPYIGNTYTLNGNDMGSTFNAKMVDGIKIPNNLSNVKVYYSTHEQVTNNVGDLQSEWKDTVEDFSTVKSYLIDLGENYLSINDEYTFTYTVNIPKEVNYNEVAYSHHAVYFSLVTNQGKYRTKIEPNKVGLTITKKYDLELIKYQKGTEDIRVTNATYSIMEFTEVGQKGKILKTDSNGSIVMSGLNLGKTYSIKEITSPTSYELNEDEVQFTTKEENGVLSVETIKGSPRKITAIQPSETEGYKVEVQVEDLVKGSIKITKTGEREEGVEASAQNLQANVRFKVTGKNFEKGKTFSTNSQGIATINGLTIGEEYILEEIKAVDGYCLMGASIKFSIVYEDNQYKLNKIENIDNNENIKQAQLETIDNIPTASFSIEDKKLPKFTLNIHKIGKDDEVQADEEVTEETEGTPDEEIPLAGVQFRLLKDNKSIGEYTTDGSGNFEIKDLYQSMEGQDVLYTLRELRAPEGYSKMKDITFKVQEVEGVLVMTTISGKIKDQKSTDNNSITVTIENGSQFTLIKQDAETKMPLKNTKFAIYNIEDDELTPATDTKGNVLGKKEEINGKEYNVLTTDDQGEITADLAKGIYKAVELEAPDEKYELAEEKYFGIGESREVDIVQGVELAKGSGGTDEDEILSIAETSDGGYIAGGWFRSNSITLEGVDGEVVVNNNGGWDGLIIKYNEEGLVEWAKVVGGEYTDEITSVIETKDRGYIAGGYFNSNSITLEGVDGKEVVVNNSGSSGHEDGLIIKYNEEGKVEWVKVVGERYGAEYITSVATTSDGGYIVGGHFSCSSITLEGVNGKEVVVRNVNVNGYDDGIIIKYNEEGKVEWAKGIGGTREDKILSVASTSDGGCIAGGYFTSKEIIIDYEHKLTNADQITEGGRTVCYDEMIIKYDKEGKVEWAKGAGGTDEDQILSIAETSDGGYIAGGCFESSSITLEGVNGEVVVNNSGSTGFKDGLIIKYNEEGLVEWVKTVGGSGSQYIKSVVSTRDGGYIAGGYFNSDSIKIEGIDEEEIVVNNNGYYDGLIIKYNEEGQVEWTKVIGGEDWDEITSIAETIDGGYIAGGYFNSTTINLGKQIKNNGNADMLIIKYVPKERPQIVTKQAKVVGGTNSDYINCVASTSDGGYIAVGYFSSSSINLGEGVNGDEVVVNNNNGNYDGLIIKYNEEGLVEWAKVVEGDKTDSIKSVALTSDGGYIAVGYFYSDSINLGEGVNGDEVVVNKNENDRYYTDGLIIKYNEEGLVEWAKVVGGTNSDYINCVASTSDGGYIAVGYFSSSSINLGEGVNGEVVVNNNGSSDGLIIKYNEEGKLEWAKGVGGTSSDEILSVASTSDGGYIAGGYFQNSSITLEGVDGGVVVNNNGNYDGLIIKYNEEGLVEWAKVVGGNSTDEISSVCETSDGGYIAGGYFQSSSITLEGVDGEVVVNNNGNYDGLIIKYNEEGLVEWAKVVGGTNNDYINCVAETSDGGYIAGGYFKSENINLGEGVNGEVVVNNNGNDDGLIIKYNEEGQVEWAKGIGGTNDYIQSVSETGDGSFIAGGYFKSEKIELDSGNTLTNNGGEDGMLIKVKAEMGAPELEELIVENNIKEYKITTSVEKIKGVKGGKISGESFDAYEIVKYNGESRRQIIITPEEGYELVKVTENGVIQELEKFIKSEDGKTYTYPQFKEMKEDKHIVVTFAKTDEKFVINKTDEKGNTLAGAKFRIEQINETDGTEDSKLYANNLITDEKGQIFLNLPEGKYNIIETKAPEGYEISDPVVFDTENAEKREVTIRNNKIPKLIVHHYVKGTDESGQELIKVADDEEYYGSTKMQNGKYQEYETKPKMNLSEYELEYELVEDGQKEYKMPTNYKGTYDPENIDENGQIVVTYYYIKRKIPLTVHHYIEGTTTRVPLASGEEAPDEKAEGDENDTYETHMLKEEQIDERYEVVEGQQDVTVTYTYPEVEVIYYYKLIEKEIQINKYGEDKETPLQGAKFKIVPKGKMNIFSEVVNNGQEYYYVDKTQNISKDTIGNIQNNGELYYIADTTKEIKGRIGEKQDGDTGYTFVYNESDGTYKPTNGEKQNKINTTAYSYFQIDLTDEEYIGKQFVVVVNARVSSESSCDIGYATITNSNSMPSYNSSSTGHFMYISGEQANNDYKSSALQGGNTYYLHLAYKKDVSSDTGEDIVVINSIKIYETNDTVSYYFEDKDNTGVYKSNNQQQANTTANSYIPINLNNIPSTEKIAIVVNAEISSQSNGDYGYATITTSQERVAYNRNDSTATRFIYISGTQNAKEYEVILSGGKQYYLHIGYYKNGTTDYGTDTFTINNVNVYGTTGKSFYFEGEGPFKSNNQLQANTIASSYIPINLSNMTGEYEVTVNAEISSENNDYGFATITTNPYIPNYYYDGTTVISNIRGEQEAKDYKAKIQGGQQYYLHFVYCKNGSENGGTDTFTINKITVGDLEYKIYTTDEKGKINVKLPLGTYEIQEIKAPEGYRIKDETIHEITINKETDAITQIDVINEKIPAQVIVHHYIYDEDTKKYTEEKVPLKNGNEAQDVIHEGSPGEYCKVEALTDEQISEKYELYQSPENVVVPYEYPPTEVTYYYKLIKKPVIINKYAEDERTPLEGAKFEIRNKEIPFSTMINNGEEYIEVDTEKEIDGKLGKKISSNLLYYFVQNEDGTYEPTNSKKYQEDHQLGTQGISNTTAHSYFPIDLSNYEGKDLVVVINAKSSSDGSDYGYATITNSREMPGLQTNNSKENGQFMRISGNKDDENYTSKLLKAGNIYYLHLGYMKNNSYDGNEDRVVINSIKLYEATGTSYSFEGNEKGPFKSNNQLQANTIASSYIPINLSNMTGEYEVTVNAEISSENNDYGFTTITTSTNRPNYYYDGTTVISNIRGEQEAKDYKAKIQGGQQYYLHFVYCKNGSENGGTDTFKINKITIGDIVYKGVYTTDESGKINVNLLAGTYEIIEKEAPEGYEKKEGIISEITINRDTETTIEVNINNEKAKAKVIVHHYIYSEDMEEYTDNKVLLSDGREAEDRVYEGQEGEFYTTQPLTDEELSEKYELFQRPESEEVPYGYPQTEVTYYYKVVKKQVKISKYQEDGTTPLGGATFEIREIDEEKSPMERIGQMQNTDQTYPTVEKTKQVNNVIGAIQGDGQPYYSIVRENTINDVVKDIQQNGQPYITEVDRTSEVDGVIKDIQNNGKLYVTNVHDEEIQKEGMIGSLHDGEDAEYVFKQNPDGTIESDNKDQHDSTANSYIPINLDGLSGNYVVVLNASISSEQSYDYGYAIIKETTKTPSEENEEERFMYMTGKYENEEFTSEGLRGGETYYLHLAYHKDSSDSDGTDTITINSIKVYEADTESYGFNTEQTETGKKYVSTNHKDNTQANSYIPIDLTNMDRTKAYALVIKAEISSEYSDYGYVALTRTKERVGRNETDNLIYISGNEPEQEYITALEGGKEYYLQLGYYKNDYTNGEEEIQDVFTINSVNVYEATSKSYGFNAEETETGKKYVSTNHEDNTEANAYMQIDLNSIPSNQKVALVVNAEVSSDGYVEYESNYNEYYTEGDYGYLAITETTDREDIDYTNIIALLAGEKSEEYTTYLQGGRTYYLHLGYYKDDYTYESTTVEDIFKVNSINVYETTIKTYDFGQSLPYTSNNKGIDGTIASSYIPIDLKEQQGTVAVVINAQISSDGYAGSDYDGYGDYGYIGVQEVGTNNIQMLTELAGENEKLEDFTVFLEAGKEYKLYFKYIKDMDIYDGIEVTDTFTINSINAYKTKEVQFYFKKDGNKYVSNNQGKPNTEASSYIPIDLQGLEGEYEITVNAEISSEYNDYGYATITYDPEMNEYYDDIISSMSGEDSGEYTVILEGGEQYYLHFGYYKDGNKNEGTDTFTINSIKIRKYDSEVYETQVSIEEGQATIELPGGKYSITEIEAPEGYRVSDEKIPDIEIGRDSEEIIEVKVINKPEGADVEQSITKDGTEKIKAKEEAVSYKITYTAEVNRYTGNAKVTIVDTLPYALDQEKMKQIYDEQNPEKIENEQWLQDVLDGGSYVETQEDDGTKIYTITWTQTETIDSTQTNEPHVISIEKNISNIVFKDMNLQEISFTNAVQGRIELNEAEQIEETEPVTHETKTDFTKNIKVTKTWEHRNSTKERPTQLVLQVKNGNDIVASYTVSEENNWTHTFIGLPKYDKETGEEIEYTIDEQAVEGEEELLKYYEKK